MPGTMDEDQCLHLLLYHSITGPCDLLLLSQPFVPVPSPCGAGWGLPLCLLSGVVTLRLAGLEVRVSLPFREPGPHPQ